MTVTESAASQAPAWWKTSASPSGEADPMAAIGSAGEPTDETAEFGFADFVDVVNPLHHIPIVGNIYRALTGDEISETSRMTGGALWGGPFGLVAALANTVTERESGQDIGGTALAWLDGDAPNDAEAPELVAASTDTATMTPLAAPDAATAVTTASLQTDIASNPQATAEPAFVAAQQTFVGAKASRLDAFIRQANAVRTPLEGPAGGSTLPGTGAFDVRSRGSTVSEGPIPLTAEGGADGGTDVAQWMMRALDKYEMMQTRSRT